MTKSDDLKNVQEPKALDRPGPSIPSVDRPWDDPASLERRLKARRGDRAAHRMHHSLYEDMLN
jgi:hypothetical protein